MVDGSRSFTETWFCTKSLAALALSAALVAGCAGGDPAFEFVPGPGDDGLGQETFEVLAAACVLTAPGGTVAVPIPGNLTVKIGDGESAFITKRGDGQTLVNGIVAGGADCVAPAGYTISVIEDSAHIGAEKVFLDLANGLPFPKGTAKAGVTTYSLTMTLGMTGTNVSQLKIRGTAAADKIFCGSTYGASSGPLTQSDCNVDGDAISDMKLVGVKSVFITAGEGDDIVSGGGTNGTGVALDKTIAFTAYGGPGKDTLTGGATDTSVTGGGASVLNGGAGDDIFKQGASASPDNMIGGLGFDLVDYSARTVATVPVSVTLCTTIWATDTCTTCIAGIATASGLCLGGASDCASAQAACVATAVPGADPDCATALTTCNTAATTAQTLCKTGPTGTCQVANDLCVTAAAGDPTDLAACASDLSDCQDACDVVAAAAPGLCTTAKGTCDTAVAACATARPTCDTCVAALPTCNVPADCHPSNLPCIADDGAAGEGDTVNDDIESVIGGAGNDTLSASWAPCTKDAGVTHGCTLNGGPGNDLLTGSSYSDTFIGGAGVDTISYADRKGSVKASLDSTNLWSLTQNGQVGEKDVIGSDVENLRGGDGDDSLRGNAAANSIWGGAGNDIIEGGDGNDLLYGEAGNDSLFGGKGNDLLVGGAGANTLVGGDGEDILDAQNSGADTLINCDGNNNSTGTVGLLPGAADELFSDGSDPAASNCTPL
jgi:Ca2+-binding RTX toxin-like protein